MSRADDYMAAFRQQGGDELVGATRLEYLARFLDSDLKLPTSNPEPVQLDTEVAYGFESVGLNMLREGAAESETIRIFEAAFRVRSALWPKFSGEQQPEDMWLLLASGTLAQRQPELRLLLSRTDLPPAPEPDATWDERVWKWCVRAAFRLCRRNDSWLDVDNAISELEALAQTQQDGEAQFLTELPADELSTDHCRLLGLYHLAETLIILGRYVRTGQPENPIARLERHAEHTRLMLGSSGDIALERVGRSVEAFAASVARASIWFIAPTTSAKNMSFIRALTSDDKPHPVSELWWSQRTALQRGLLDPVRAAISVQMPTSAGKTLIAEFAMIQALALNPDSSIAHVVPTRALVNQATRRLRNDFAGLTIDDRELSVEAAVPAFELDPTEEAMLSARPDVLVTTPEKLDLLVRSGHQSVANLSLVVVDEAHHISDAERGPRLELLLATLKHERGRSCRYLLLTPFLPNAVELASWLGGTDGAAIQLDWTPSEQVRALGHWTRRKGTYFDALHLVPSATQSTVWDGAELELGPAKVDAKARTRQGISTSLAISLSEGQRGGTLILTRGAATAEARAQQISDLASSPLRAADADLGLLEAAVDYISAELGTEYPLAACLRNGVAFHHAGLPPEVRSLVELLLDRELVKVVAGTTTLAQGVDFPLSSVIIETLKISQGRGRPERPLRFSEFWNIAGRAGRALKDAVGLVVYPSTGPAQDRAFRDYLSDEAAVVASALANVVTTLDENSTDYGLELVRSQPSLSYFLQYLAHALRIAGLETATAQIEELLRSSLVFHELRATDRDTAEKLVRWCRDFMARNDGNRSVGVADSTGLSLPSVGYLYRRAEREYREPDFWQAGNLFGPDIQPLTHIVELLGALPEMKLAPSDQPGPMNARRVAKIMRDWVTGKTLPEIAETHFGSKPDDLQRAGRYLFRDLSRQLPWGLGALQTISIGSNDSDAAALARRTPALAFYGVDDVAALPLRMVGVPRLGAGVLGASAPQFTSFAQARSWVAGLPSKNWDEATKGRAIDGAALRRVWVETGGTAA